MTLPFKPHVLALICSAGLLAASGVLYVKSRTPEAPTLPTPPIAAQPLAPAEATPVAKVSFTTAQIDQWVAPIALYPDPLLSQVLMASTYPANVVQAAQWSRDNPTRQGDAAIQAVANQPWDPSVKSLVAFPQLMTLMGENTEWVQNLGDAFLAQPQDVMDSVQRLRLLAQQTGSLKSTPQQTVTSTPKKSVAAAPSTTSSATKSSAVSAAPASTVIKIEPADPQVVYIPSYNPATVYGTWPNTAYPPVYLPPTPGEQFAGSFVKGFGYSLGVATTYALFSNIDWDDDHHHDDDHHDGHGYQHNGDNININVDNFNRISGQNLKTQNITWQHNPAWRGGVPYQNGTTAPRFHPTDVSGGLSATQQPAATASRDSQRQAAMAQLQQRHPDASKALAQQPTATTRDAQRKAAAQQLNQVAQRNNYRGYDDNSNSARRQNAQQTLKQSTTTAQQLHRDDLRAKAQQRPISQPQRETVRQRVESSSPQQRQAFQQNHANVFSGNDSRSPNWQSQQQRGQESRRLSNISNEQRAHMRERASEHHEFRHR
ncbi:DUF3300 domain-containing protein [Citrobacter amalonaticus]|uniref:DUF3300 domain-containing protein n=1 Tax=Citrobacter amalonaticus TaxID=35703 RepID=UPI00228C588E|nr:DUF3300 domain-containing protein [Citrobacter amalonaticus]MDT7069282.1 DUF3300 domain-containing protein [Citrobacter amalonaticus]HCW3113211.1 DUF3300 domain-containing protein [Citrobacter amalonaticus]